MSRDPFVSDASPLIALAQIDRLQLIERLFVQVVVPPAVAREITPTLPHPPAWIVERPLSLPLDPAIVRASLDPGESEAISLALERAAPGVVLDDRRARRLAHRLGLHVVGTLGVLLLAKRRRLIPALRPEIEALDRVRFHFGADVARSVLLDAGEEIGIDPDTS